MDSKTAQTLYDGVHKAYQEYNAHDKTDFEGLKQKRTTLFKERGHFLFHLKQAFPDGKIIDNNVLQLVENTKGTFFVHNKQDEQNQLLDFHSFCKPEEKAVEETQ